MKRLIVTSFLFSLLFSLQTFAQTDARTEAFWEKLKAHCGQSFQGEVITGMTDDFKSGPLVMHVRSCEENEIRIPFMVGENRSRTWILTKKGTRILLKHDHRHADGSPDSISMYGGWSTNAGMNHLQVFPADEETTTMLPAAAGNVWWITIDDQFFSYNLRRIGTERVFTVRFNLQKPVSTPPAPWGTGGSSNK